MLKLKAIARVQCQCELKPSEGTSGNRGIQVRLQPPTLAQVTHSLGQKDQCDLRAPTLPRGVGWEDIEVMVKVPEGR